MGIVVEDLLRLAWQAERDGRPGLRDVLLTLAVAESGADDAVLAERCRRLLTSRQPDHWFAGSATLGLALTRPRVAAALPKLRAMFPPVRVRHLLLRGDARRGPYTGKPPRLAQVLRDLALATDDAPATRTRPAVAAPAPPLALSPAGVAPGSPAGRDGDPDGALARSYFTVLMAMAVLLDSVLRPEAAAPSRDHRAA